jgi:hypothetical protein
MRRALPIALAAIAVLAMRTASFANNAAPYTHVPVPGDSVRLDGTMGGATEAWAYADQNWLEEYLRATIDAAASNKPYSDMTAELNRVASHVTRVSNGTPGSIEAVEPFSYDGRIDVEIRVLVQSGPLKGRELWTTCAEVVDSAGHPYMKT